MCDKRYKRNDRYIHLKVYTDEGPYACTVWKRSFSKQMASLAYISTHKNDKKFPGSLSDRLNKDTENLLESYESSLISA